jgi:hypothetical protein
VADDWFEDALDDVIKHTPKGGKFISVHERVRLAEEARLKADAAADPRAAKEAAKIFGAARAAGGPIMAGPVASYIPVPPRTRRPTGPTTAEGYVSSNGRVRSPLAISPQEAVDAILAHVRSAGDATEIMKAGGQWITAVTNGIADIIRESGDE